MSSKFTFSLDIFLYLGSANPTPILYSTRGVRQWHPTPVLLPGKSHGWRSLEGCSPWGRWGLDTTEWLHFHFSLSHIGEGNGNSLQCSCLENPRDGGAWWAAVYGVTQSRTELKRLSSSSSRGLSECAHFRIEGQVWIENDQGRVCRVGENKQKGQSWGEKKQYLFHVRSLLQKY